MPPGAHASCNALLQLLLCSAAELGSDSIPDPIRFKPSRFRGLPVRQRVARLRLLIYTSCGAAAAATAAAPGSATATASASEVQRSRRVAAMATAAWKFIYFTAMIWQYFNGNRISPSSTHFSLFSNLATLSLSALLFLYTLPALLSIYSPCSLFTILILHSTESSLLFLDSPFRTLLPHSSLHNPFPTLLTLHSSLLPHSLLSLSPTFSHCFLYILHTLLFTLPPLLISLYTLSPSCCFSFIPLLLSLCCCSCACLGCR